ncbi:heat-inducible transcription repressor HrcA [Nitriliruptoraceae bacterium ZYF776]|nr:heat-inducible transcription repressor HrcA [Profundirhabdus halotolerans]
MSAPDPSRPRSAGSDAASRPAADAAARHDGVHHVRAEVPAADALAAAVAPPDGTPVPDLDERKLTVLRAIVTEYIADGEPVGSKRVVEVAALDVSAATVRNEMAALEELGFIAQPHTSAGRVPTDRGYRRFVDDLADNAGLDGPRRELVQELLGSARDVEDLLARTSSVLSQLTRLVSLVIAPAVDASRCKLVELVGLSSTSALLLLVADTGRVEKRTVELPPGTGEAELDRVRTVLGEQVRGRRMGEVHPQLSAIADTAPGDLRDVLRAVADATAADLADDTVHHVFVGGRASLADEAALERDQLSRVLQLLEQRATVARLLADTPEDDAPVVRIGGENAVADLRATSLVSQRYELVSAGSLGVLGPTRMDYAGVLSTVRAVAEQLQQTLTDLSR